MRLLIAVLAPLFLFGCVLTPGKFISTMTINADRSFAFTYKGEVIALDPGSGLKDVVGKSATDDKADKETSEAKTDESSETKNRAIAEALSKEYGYRSVVYQGKGKFLIDYAIKSRLTHNFTFPFNSDAEAIVPFLVVELRANNSVRVQAPGFANGNSRSAASGGMGSAMSEPGKALDGIFTIDTDAEIVSQNNEDGALTTGNRRTVSWRATPLTKDAPTAVLRLKP